VAALLATVAFFFGGGDFLTAAINWIPSAAER
jgi:hypothetical protein